MPEVQSAFDPVILTWKGKDHLIQANRVMGAIARVENYITLKELVEMSAAGSLKLVPIAAAFASMLRYAGVTGVTDEDVYAEMFSGADPTKAVVSSVETLLMLMIPPSQRNQKEAGPTAAVGKSSRNQRRAAAKLSRRRTRQPALGD